MQCGSCGHDYPATNQHSECPKCGKVLGTAAERDYTDEHASKVAWFKAWDDWSIEHRKRQERDLQYLNGIQWTSEEIEELRRRGQPVVTYNRIRKKYNYLVGMEIRNRTDPKARPRTPKHDDDSDAATDILRYIADSEDYPRHDTENYKDLLGPGVCGTVIEHETIEGAAPSSYGDETQAPQGSYAQPEAGGEIEIRRRSVSWDRLFWDPHSRKPDFSDALYRGIVTWMDVAEAKRFYKARPDRAPDFEQVIDDTCQGNAHDGGESHEDKPKGWWDPKRKRIRIAETFYLKDGEYYVCHATQAGFLVRPKPVGYVDKRGKNVCPLLMSSAYVNSETGERYGIIRDMIGPQDEINKRRSKYLHQISLRQVIAEDGAVLQPDEARTELAKPDGWIALQRDALKNQRFQISQTQDMAQSSFQLLAEAKSEIDQTGPDAPMIGTSSATSGVQLQMQQQIGSLELEPIIDNHRRLKREVHRQTFLRASQFWTYKKVLRVTDDAESAGYRFVEINRRTTKAQRMQELMQLGMTPDGALQAVNVPPQAIQMHMQMAAREHAMRAQQTAQAVQVGMAPPEALAMAQQPPEPMQVMLTAPALQEPYTVNDVAGLDVDIILDEAPDTAIVEQEELMNLREIGQSMIAAGQPFPLEMYIEASPLRSAKKKRMLAKLKESQQPGPAQEAQMQQLQQQMQMMAAQIQALQAKAQRDLAEAQKTEVETQLLPAKTQAEAGAKQAQALNNAATAGNKAAGPMRMAR